jgi:hypothetical protein
MRAWIIWVLVGLVTVGTAGVARAVRVWVFRRMRAWIIWVLVGFVTGATAGVAEDVCPYYRDIFPLLLLATHKGSGLFLNLTQLIIETHRDELLECLGRGIQAFVDGLRDLTLILTSKEIQHLF